MVILLLFGITGCISSPQLDTKSEEKLEDELWQEWKEVYINKDELIKFGSGVPTYDYETKKISVSKLLYKVDYSKNKIDFKSKGTPFYSWISGSGRFNCHRVNIETYLPNICFSEFGGGVKVFPELVDNPVYKKCNLGIDTTGMTVIKNENFSVECFTAEEYKVQKEEADKYHAEQMAMIEAKKLEERKSICRTYGFKDETDGMGLCLIELDKLDALKKQISANNLAQSNLIAQQQEAAQAQALINLGAIIGGAGVPNNPQPIPSSPSYPESYSMSRTVPSNQNCPLLGVPLKKQEVKNGNRICYY